MAVPPRTHEIWKQIVSGQKNFEFDSLAVKFFLGHVRIEVSRNPASVSQLAGQLHELFIANEALPSVRKDLSKLPA